VYEDDEPFSDSMIPYKSFKGECLLLALHASAALNAARRVRVQRVGDRHCSIGKIPIHLCHFGTSTAYATTPQPEQRFSRPEHVLLGDRPPGGRGLLARFLPSRPFPFVSQSPELAE
jgi:hypothetical protein